MKKLTLFAGLILTLVFAVSLTSCGPSNSAELLEQLNKELPKDAGSGLTMTKAELDGDQFVLVCELGDAAPIGLGMLKMAGNSPEVKKAFLESDIKDVAEILVNENKSLVLRFTDKEGSDNFDMTFTPDELKKAL